MVSKKLPGRDSLPPVTFKNFVTELASTALVCLGCLESPVLKRKNLDLPRAAHVIGLLDMLAEKTRGNLREDEDEYLQAVLSDLQVKLAEQSPEQAG
ncbi:MAG: DUF1844 domain-containing protein [Planctomycetes bacterium]|nr:DUF1844 domain-containing protein [Planctomycetota bacterium]